MKRKKKVILFLAFIIVAWFVISRSLSDTDETKFATSDAEVFQSKEIELAKVKAVGDLVAVNQAFSKEYIDTDSSFLGNRITTFNLSGEYQLGINTADIEITQIDNVRVKVKLPDVKLISLEIPYDKVDISKTGPLRKKMNEDELKKMYAKIDDQFRKEILNDSDTILQAQLYNEYAVDALIRNLTSFTEVQFIK